MPDPTPEEGLIALQRRRVCDLRVQLGDLRHRLINNDWKSPLFKEISEANVQLDMVQAALESGTADPQKISEQLEAIQQVEDSATLQLAQRAHSVMTCLGLYATILFILSALTTCWLWQNATTPTGQAWINTLSSVPAIAQERWSVLRAASMACTGALLGSAIFLFRVIYNVGSGRPFNMRRAHWYAVSPIFAVGLAIAVFACIRAGFLQMMGTSGAGAGAAPTSAGAGGNNVGAAGAFAAGFLIGFDPGSVMYRLNGVIKALFGADEVQAPQISVQQATVQGSRISLRCTVTPSPAAQVLSVSVKLKSSVDVKRLCALTKGADNIWKGDAMLPGDIDVATAVLFVEAADDRNNVSISEPISLTPIGASDSGESGTSDSSTEQPAPPTPVLTSPAAGATIAGDANLVITFSQPMRDADPALTTAPPDEETGGQVIEITEKVWNDTKTVLTLKHPALAAGKYRLRLESAQLQDPPEDGDDELDEEVQVDFSV